MLPAKALHSAKPGLTPSLEHCRVVSGLNDRCVVAASFGDVAARRAASCLLEPGPEDLVLVSLDMAGGAWVLAVLERAGAGPARLSVVGDASLAAVGGSLTLASGRDMSLTCPGELSAASEAVNVHAARGRAVIAAMSFLGTTLKTQAGRIQTVARRVELTCRELTQRLVRGQRFVQEHDEEQVGSKRVLAEQALSLHAENCSIMAEEQVVVNAEQINMS